MSESITTEESTMEEQAVAIYDHVRAAYVGDPIYVFDHAELMAVVGMAGKPSNRYYDLMSLVRGRLKREGILLRSKRKTGYRFLNARDLGRHALHKLDLAVTNVDEQRETLSLFIARVDAGEETGFDEIEIMVMEAFEADLAASVNKARLQRQMLIVRGRERKLMLKGEAKERKRLESQLERAQTNLADIAGERKKLRGLARRQAKSLEKAKAAAKATKS